MDRISIEIPLQPDKCDLRSKSQAWPIRPRHQQSRTIDEINPNWIEEDVGSHSEKEKLATALPTIIPAQALGLILAAINATSRCAFRLQINPDQEHSKGHLDSRRMTWFRKPNLAAEQKLCHGETRRCISLPFTVSVIANIARKRPELN